MNGQEKGELQGTQPKEGLSPSDIDAKIRALEQQRDLQISALSRDPSAWWQLTGSNPMTLGVTVLVFGLLVMMLATYLIRLGRNAQTVLRILGTISVITLAIFLVVVGYSDRQITLVMGLLGTVVGYLLGRESVSQSGQQREEKGHAPGQP